MNAKHLCPLLVLSAASLLHAADWGTITVLTDPFDPTKTVGVSVESSHLRAVQRNTYAQADDYQFGYVALVDAINGRSNQAGSGILDGAPGGKPMTSITVLADTDAEISYRVAYQDGRRWVYTYYPSSPVVRVDYTSWNYFKAFQDFCTPGGSRDDNQPVIYGSGGWKREIIDMTEGAYYDRATDGSSGGSLNYNGWMIFGIYNPDNLNGYARVFQFEKLKRVKLMYDIGIEAFFTDAPVTGYLFPFSNGEDEMLQLALAIVARHADGLGMANMGATVQAEPVRSSRGSTVARLSVAPNRAPVSVNLAGRLVRVKAATSFGGPATPLCRPGHASLPLR